MALRSRVGPGWCGGRGCVVRGGGVGMRTKRVLWLALVLALLVALGSIGSVSAGAGASEEGDPDW